MLQPFSMAAVYKTKQWWEEISHNGASYRVWLCVGLVEIKEEGGKGR